MEKQENILDLIIVGAQKAGTTSLNNYLRSHSDISGHEMLEFSFFVNEDEYKEGFDKVYNKYFEKKPHKKIIAKNVTISIIEESLQRLKVHNPDVKIVLVLREPVSRAYSAYTMAVSDGWMQRPFTDFIEIIQRRKFDDIMYRHFVGHGLYDEQIKMILKYFPAKNLRLYLFEDFTSNPQNVCDDIFNWLDLTPNKIEDQVHNPTRQPRSGSFSKILIGLRDEKSQVKKIIKKVLPYSAYKKMGDKVIDLNKSNKKFDSIDSVSNNLLTEHFRDSVNELNTLIEENDIRLFTSNSTNSWLNSYPAH